MEVAIPSHIFKLKMFSRQFIWLLIENYCVVALLESGTTARSNNMLTGSTKTSTAKNIEYRAENIFTLLPTTLEPIKVEQKTQTWLMYCSAVPTILVFIVAVIVIAVKNLYIDQDDLFAPDDTDGLIKLSSPSIPRNKKPRNPEVYDAMLARFKEEKTKKQTISGRKSSQIRIEGMGGRSPKSLAHKHLMIGKLNHDDVTPNQSSSALGQLVQLSTHTFIGSTIIDEIKDEDPYLDEEKFQLKNIIEKTRKDIEEVKRILPDDVNEALLPEDLEEAFMNFATWEESLI